MTLKEFILYFFSIVLVVFSILTVTGRHILRAAFYLLCVLVATAGIYFLLDYQFLFGIQLTLYAGGIVVLIIFSVLLTSHISQKFPRPDLFRLIGGLSLCLVGFAVSVYAILKYPFEATSQPTLTADMKIIGKQLLETGKDGYALPFEVLSILLLAVLIGAIIIAKKSK